MIGRRDRLSDNLLRSIEQSERLSASCTGMHLRVAVDYSSQYSLTKAAELAARGAAANTGTDSRRYRAITARGRSFGARRKGPVDLLIRTGNERRLSDFLLWECAYAELHFSGVPLARIRRSPLSARTVGLRGAAATLRRLERTERRIAVNRDVRRRDRPRENVWPRSIR